MRIANTTKRINPPMTALATNITTKHMRLLEAVCRREGVTKRALIERLIETLAGKTP